MEKEMIKKINEQITEAALRFKIEKRHSAVDNARINGMIDMLKIVTGKNYYYDESGVHENK